MFPPKRIAGFAFRLVLLYVLLVAPWPGLKEAYSTVYRTVANAVFGSFGSDGVVRFQPHPEARREFDTEIIIQRRGSPVKGKITHSARVTGYLPTVGCIALIVATSIPWRRRLKALAWGMILVNGFVVLRVWITLFCLFSREDALALYHPSPFWSKCIGGLFEFVAVTPACTFLGPVLIWILVSLREGDWAESRKS